MMLQMIFKKVLWHSKWQITNKNESGMELKAPLVKQQQAPTLAGKEGYLVIFVICMVFLFLSVLRYDYRVITFCVSQAQNNLFWWWCSLRLFIWREHLDLRTRCRPVLICHLVGAAVFFLTGYIKYKKLL